MLLLSSMDVHILEPKQLYFNPDLALATVIQTMDWFTANFLLLLLLLVEMDNERGLSK